MLLAVLVLGGFAFYIMNAEERERVYRVVRALGGHLRPVGFFLFCALRTFIPAVRARNRQAQALAAMLGVVATMGIVQAMRTPPTDIRPEIERLVAAEARMTAIYDAATTQFTLGAISADALAQVIERRIRPELQVVRIRVMSLENVGSEQQAPLAKAKEYLHLRGESWRLRIEALHRRNLPALRKVEATERASLAALHAAVDGMKPL